MLRYQSCLLWCLFKNSHRISRVWGCCCGGYCYNNRNDDALYRILYSEQKLEVLACTIFSWEYSQLESRLHFLVSHDLDLPNYVYMEVVQLPKNVLKRKIDAFSFHFFLGLLTQQPPGDLKLMSALYNVSGSKNRAHAHK